MDDFSIIFLYLRINKNFTDGEAKRQTEGRGTKSEQKNSLELSPQMCLIPFSKNEIYKSLQFLIGFPHFRLLMTGNWFV